MGRPRIKKILPHFHRHSAKDIPSTEDSIKKWCEDRWVEKEKSLEKFYSAPPPTGRHFSRDFRCDRPWNAMYLALVGWTAITAYTMYLTFTTTLGFYWVLFCTVAFILVSYFTTGMQQLEIDLFRKYDHPEVSTEQTIRKANNGIFYKTDTTKNENGLVKGNIIDEQKVQ
jgi:hypothetical protein